MSDTSPTPEGAFIPEDRKAEGDRGPLPEEPATAVASVAQQRPPSFLQRQGIAVLVAAVVAAVVAVVVATSISVGLNLWMANSGGRGNRLVQEGKVTVPLNREQEVFYPIPFAGPPNVVLEGNVDLNVI